jgi:hypothetical protein
VRPTRELPLSPHLAVAIAYRAIQNVFDTRFTTATALIDQLLASVVRLPSVAPASSSS